MGTILTRDGGSRQDGTDVPAMKHPADKDVANGAYPPGSKDATSNSNLSGGVHTPSPKKETPPP